MPDMWVSKEVRDTCYKNRDTTHPEVTWNEFQSLYRTLSEQVVD